MSIVRNEMRQTLRTKTLHAINENVTVQVRTTKENKTLTLIKWQTNFIEVTVVVIVVNHLM